MTDLQPFTEPQTRQLHVLRARGFNLRILYRDEEKLQVVVAGRTPSNERMLGLIDGRGAFRADLIDSAPAIIAVGAPSDEPAVEEVVG